MPPRHPGQVHDVGEVHLAEGVLRSGPLAGRAQAAEHVVHAGEVGDLRQTVEIDQALGELLVSERELSAGEHGDAVVRRILEQQPQHLAPDQARGTGDEGGTGHALSATARAGRS